MNTTQEDKLSMYYVVKSTGEKYQATWVTNAVFAATYNLWTAKLPLIEQNRDAQTLETTGITTDKITKRNAMTEKALFIANRLQSYANVTGNTDLLESVQYSASDMKKARDTDVVGICDVILSRANANAAAIVSYGVTAALITDLQTAITTYSATLAKPKAAKSQTKTATENLAKLFKETDDLLNKRLDLDIELFKSTKPEFYSQYKTARMIVPTGGNSTAVLGKVTIAGSGEPVKGVTLTFIMDGNSKSATALSTKPIIKKSAEKGNFRIANLAEGTYKVVVKKIGFKEQTLIVNVVKNETTHLNVEIEKN
jgi:hypothetical protein